MEEIRAIRIETPNGIKETKTLNYFSKFLRKTDLHRKQISEEGFEIAFDGQWEYIINFKGKNGFMVFREDENGDIILFLYPTGKELNVEPFVWKCNGGVMTDKTALNLCKGIKQINQKYIK